MNSLMASYDSSGTVSPSAFCLVGGSMSSSAAMSLANESIRSVACPILLFSFRFGLDFNGEHIANLATIVVAFLWRIVFAFCAER